MAWRGYYRRVFALAGFAGKAGWDWWQKKRAAGIAVSKLDPLAGLCVASGTLVAKTAIDIATSRLALAETKLGAEIAFVHDVKAKFGRSE